MNTFFFDDVQYPEGLFGGKDFFNPIIYSTEEREVGVWIDNKPLYAKTFIQQLSGNAGQVDISACGADMMFAHSGYYDIGVTMLGLNERLNNQYLTYTHVNLDTMQYIDCCNTIATNSKIIVCCLYTKINDVAGSGSYTTLGIPAVHYDGNEKIVGTYFGETLYERTLNFTQDNRIYYIPNTTYVKKLVKHNGECTKDNFDFQIPYYDGIDYVSVGNNSNGVRIYSSNYFVGAVYELTIQYTKTS